MSSSHRVLRVAPLELISDLPKVLTLARAEKLTTYGSRTQFLEKCT
jgi:hypothetical protein